MGKKSLFEQLFSLYKNTSAHSGSFLEFSPLLTRETLSAAYAGKKPAFSLKRMAGKVRHCDRFHMWQRLFELRDVIPEKELFDIYVNSLNDPGQTYWQEINTDAGPVYISTMPEDPELLKTLPLTSELLIDNNVVLCRYCQVQKPGWEMLRYIRGRRASTQKMPDKMREAIDNDNIEMFMICKDMSGKRLSYSLLAEIMTKKAFGIFRYLLENGEIVPKVIPLEELCVYSTVQFEDADSIAFLKIIEELYPGTVKNFRDRWGRNLLWYGAIKRGSGFFHPYCQLTPFLLEQGCDPDNVNQLGFSWRFVLKTLSLIQKQQMMRRRYARSVYSPYPALQNQQPLHALADKSCEPQWMKDL